jgi:hypothetical protein
MVAAHGEMIDRALSLGRLERDSGGVFDQVFEDEDLLDLIYDDE